MQNLLQMDGSGSDEGAQVERYHITTQKWEWTAKQHSTGLYQLKDRNFIF